MSSSNAFILDRPKTLVAGKGFVQANLFFNNSFLHLSKGALTLYHTIPTFNDPEKKAFWNHCMKRRKCLVPAFSSFPRMFSTFPKQISFFQSHLFCCLQMLSIWMCPKILLFGKELMHLQKAWTKVTLCSLHTQNFLLLVNFLHVTKKSFLLII